MKYNTLGRTGLRVSEFSLGSWINFGNSLDIHAARKLMREAFDHGINFFDNAEVYAKGKSEEIMGFIIREYRREDLVVSTKIFWGGNGPNDTGLSRKHLLEGTTASLKRLQVDYVDVLFCHRPDPTTPIEETVRAMDYLVREGMVLYWGTSQWSAAQIRQAIDTARELNCIPPVCEQPQYNMFHREHFDLELGPIFEEYGFGATTWSPLNNGILTGKYLDGIPKGSRLDANDWLQKELTPEKSRKLRKLTNVAKDLGCTMAQLAIAWCATNPKVSSVITGASSVEQLNDNLRAIGVKELLTPDVLAEIDELLR